MKTIDNINLTEEALRVEIQSTKWCISAPIPVSMGILHTHFFSWKIVRRAHIQRENAEIHYLILNCCSSNVLLWFRAESYKMRW